MGKATGKNCISITERKLRMSISNYKEPIAAENGKGYKCLECGKNAKQVSYVRGKGWVCTDCFEECRSCGLKGGGNE